MKLSSLSLVFPAFNEGANIARLVEQALAVGKLVSADYEVVIVNDGSRDQTRAVLRRLAKAEKRLKVIDRQENKGYGFTVWEGLKAADKEWVFFSDSDLQFDLKEIKRLVDQTPKARVILGYRSPRRDSWMRLLNAKLWNKLVWLLFGLQVKDIDCAFKLFHRQALQKIEVRSGGATFSAELLLRLKRQGEKFIEVPVSHRPRRAGSPTGAKLSVITRAFRELFALYRQTDLGRPIYREAVKFGLVGIFNTAVDYLVLNFTYLILDLNLYLAVMIGFLAGSVNGYWMNNRWTYRHLGRQPSTAGAVKYTIIGLVGLGLTELVIHLLTVQAGINYNLSKLLAVAVVFVWNFFGNRLWTFRTDRV